MKYLLIILSFLFVSCDWGFLNSIWDDDDKESVTPPSVEEYFSFNTSSKQAFYWFNQILINNNPITDEDWVAAFNNDICVGSIQWNTLECNNGICTLPVLGNSQTDETEGYMLPGEIPSFKIYDSSENEYYDAVPSEEIPWQEDCGLLPDDDCHIETLHNN